MGAHPLKVFVSSRVYELVDLRAAVKSFLESLGVHVMMSEEVDFPDDGHGLTSPYVGCLDTLETCELVVVILDRTYGHAMPSWAPRDEYNGLAPTHAEYRQAIGLGKRLLVFVRERTMTHYETWRKSPEAFTKPSVSLPEPRLLELIREVKTARDPIPWVYSFRDSEHLIQGLRGAFVNELYAALRTREEAARTIARALAGKIADLSPEVRAELESQLTPGWAAERAALAEERDTARARLAEVEQQASRANDAEQAAAASRHELEQAQQRLARADDMLAAAAARDVRWLTVIRTQLMPPEPGRVPFHNDREVALRGFHVRDWEAPTLTEVTWSRVHYKDNGRHRGYHAAIMLKGSNFAPGIVYERRRSGEAQAHVFRHSPSIYFGDYLEIAAGVTGDNEDGLSWRGFEFRVVNPDGKSSDWLPFTYPWDDDALVAEYREHLKEGTSLLEAGQATEARARLRKAWVFADRLPMIPADEKARAHELHERAIDEAQLARLRFRPGARLRVLAGPYVGRIVRVREIARRHHHAYRVEPDDDAGGLEGHAQVADDQVEEVASMVAVESE